MAKLLLGVAHAVRTVDAGLGIMLNAGASVLVLFTDVAKDVTVVLLREILGGRARERLEHAVTESAIGSGRKGISDLPVLGDGRASSRRVAGLVGAHLGRGWVDGGQLSLEDIVVLERLDRVAGDLGNTVVVLLLVEHIDNTAAEYTGHLIRVKSSGVIPETAFGTTNSVATVFGEEDGNRVVGEEVDLDIVAGLLKAALTTPRVDVVTPEVNGLFLVTTVEEMSHVSTNLGVIVGSVANTHPASTIGHLVGDILLGVTSSSLDVSGGTSFKI